MKGLDLSKLKKVSSDKSSTVFQHSAGHTVRIAHSALNAKLRDEINKIPIHKASGGEVKRYAEGTPDEPVSANGSDELKSHGVNININTQPQAPMQPQSVPVAQPMQNQPVAINPSTQNMPMDVSSQGDPNAEGYNPQKNDPIGPGSNTSASSQAISDPEVHSAVEPDTSSSQELVQQQATPQPEAPVAQSQNKQMAAEPSTQLAPQDTRANVKQELSAEAKAWEQDLENGHITPETYGDLFAKKSTLGKIGMIFGMLLSGAGSGLAQQPNALMQLMQNEINNDLESQKQSKGNAQNFIRLNQQHQLNQAQIHKMVQEGTLTEAQAKLAGVEADNKAWALSQSQALQSSYHSLIQKTNALPEGPQKEAAKQQLAIIYGKVADRINDINDQAAGAAEYYKTLFNQGSASQSGEQGFQQKMSGMRMLGPQGEARAKDVEEKHFPGLQGQASIPLTGEDRNAINSGIDFDQKLHRFTEWTKNHSGDLSPSDKRAGQALAAELQGAYRQATHGGVYKEGEQNFISKIIDSDPTKFFNSVRVLPQLKAISGENRARVNQLVKSKGFSGYTGSQGQESSSSPQYKMVNGVKYMRGPNGEAVKVN